MKKTMTFAAALLAASVLSGMASAKTLVYCSEASPANFDPGTTTGGNDFDASSRTVYSRLVEFKHGGTEIEPGLADKWEISDDGLVYTFHLHPGVKFQTTDYFKPTRDLNADDVVFSFDRQFNKENPWNGDKYLPNLTWDYYTGMDMPKYVAKWEKVDDLTVKLTLTEPNAPMLANLGMDFASIVSKEYADQLQKDGKMADFSTKPIGTGPFQFVDYQLDSVIRYAANPDYFKGKEKIDDLVFAITPDATARIQKVLAGECDIAPYPNPADIATIKANKDVTLMDQAGLNIGYMSYNTTIPPLDKPEVRHALNQAIDREALIKSLFQDAGAIPAENLIPPTMWSWDKDVKTDAYNPDEAKKVLEAAGLKEIQLWAADRVRPYNPNFQRAAELIQADWAKVGVKANIVNYEWTKYREEGKKKDRPGAFQIGWTGDNGDPDNFFATLFACSAIGVSNYSSWCDKDFEDLIQKAKKTSDQAERTKLYEQAQVIFAKEAPAFLLAHSQVYSVVRNNVTGYKMDPLGIHRFDGVDKAE
ncbi:ABC transporter substrate-binding protein [Mesorhizobium sp. B3-1-6]|uniref:ABC transporter substrate-binding protein n=1 Tax=Mesorhizobium sp. B3-1-6 TaxID=2589895 RepID=UPI0011270012|nr:ABC transporter substrate-binding protein [Mesorhizobium sp. B3-1-6]TPI29949.1 ABC transporter substrate-binding protein [Mesorhizobium sp. B3-1-6]